MQLQINFENEYNPEWIKPKKYDFYIPSMNLIVEMDGGLGHGKNKHGKSNISKEESKAIDDYKDEQARKHGIKVVRIDCDYKHNNRFEFIKQNIIDSKLNEILNLNKIDWDECELFGLTNLIKIACDYKNNNSELTTTQIGKIMGYHPTTILSWLKQGNGIWCNYDATKEVSRASSRSGKMNGKSVEIFKNGISLGIFPSCCELSRRSLDLFGVKFYEGSISAVCLGKIKQHKGFTFKYI
jgi:very-short-patch-repair endonuclease